MIPAGATLCICKGEYSSYCIMGHFKVLKDFHMADLETALKKTKNSFKNNNFDKALTWLIREGFIEDTEVYQIDLESEWSGRTPTLYQPSAFEQEKEI